MIRLDTYRCNWMWLGFLLLVKCLPVWSGAPNSSNFTSLNFNSDAPSSLNVGDTLVSTPLGIFELGIFLYAGSYYLCIRYKLPIEQVDTWMANRDNPLSDTSTLQFSNDGILELIDPQNDKAGTQPIWTTKAGGPAVVTLLLDTGNLVLKDKNGVTIWSSFNDSSPTDTLLPGQRMYRNQNNRNKLTSWQKNGSPATASGSYSFGWENGILALSWTSPKKFLKWKGGTYIPAGDVHDAHTISDVDYVYFHEILGHLYISSTPSNTAIVSGGPDKVNSTSTLKRITIGTDGGFRIWQCTIGQNATNWTAMANWVVSDRPDSRSQCTSFGTCGPYGMCTSAVDSLDFVVCECPAGFQPINGNAAQGCILPQSASNANCTNATMLELAGVDMPWGGGYELLTGSTAANCKDECAKDSNCNGAVYSSMEQKCRKKTGFMYNLGYPTVASHGNDRTAYIKLIWNPLSLDPPVTSNRKERTLRLVEIVVPTVVGSVFLLVAFIVFLRRCDKVREGCGLCSWSLPRRDKFPGDYPGSE